MRWFSKGNFNLFVCQGGGREKREEKTLPNHYLLTNEMGRSRDLGTGKGTEVSFGERVLCHRIDTFYGWQIDLCI